MNTKFIFLCIIAFIFFSSCHKVSEQRFSEEEQVRLILDTDLGPDYDDVGAMALMHALADSGEVKILATLSSNKDERVVPCIDILNRFFNRPDIPLGASKGESAPSLTTWHKVKWTDVLPQKYPHSVASTSEAPDAVKQYRKILSEQPDTSVTICTIGFFTNLSELLNTAPDEFSPLNGIELVRQKVKRLVAMAGYFPTGREFNIYNDVAASQNVAEHWPTEIIFSGFEIGNRIFTGKGLVKQNFNHNPVKDAYALCFAEGDPNGRMSWDQTAVLVAIKGYEPFFRTERGTFSIISADGTNDWTPSENGKHLRLIEKLPFESVATIIEKYMMHQPIK